MSFENIKPWIVSLRLRTLPLSASCIIMGSFLAAYKGNFDIIVFFLALATTLLLQILSNLSNEYG
ncbi:MAG TPA: 1,4-dihydroxy-2-naphthoate polyprenyltransferase, partial [Spirochaetota bacterium]|nr:1,4-dihydroxy-2-naphthoate polyprenyltransferase [Spirochaetota bacterium]HRX46498.1 1,4-dihydroxy-2-naphthoate polyprenyltransferase [Spirochaetota bacterium]